MQLAIIGTGNVGANLGIRLKESGYDVVFGVRASRDVSELLGQCAGRARAASVAEAAGTASVNPLSWATTVTGNCIR